MFRVGISRILFALTVISLILATGCTTAPHTPPADSLPVPATSPSALSLSPTIVRTPAQTSVTPVPTLTTMPSQAFPTTTPEPQRTRISESALNAKIRDAKNKMELYKESDRVGTILTTGREPPYCEMKISKELGYGIDVDTGDDFSILGTYGSIDAGLFASNMTKGHTYILIHSHAKDFIYCPDSATISFNTFSLGDLSVTATLAREGYHIREIIVISDKTYEIYPEIPGTWKDDDEIYPAIAKVEKFSGLTYHTSFNGKTYYLVDRLMPSLANELHYVYKINNAVPLVE